VRYLLAFVHFVYDFVVGDDWLIAVGVVAAIALTSLIADRGLAAWWVMLLSVIVLLLGSVRRGLRRASARVAERGPL
jgi:membrane protein implicated in regulation of membrane protease activity